MYSEIKEGCRLAGYIHEEDGVEVCGLSRDKRCWAHSCPVHHFDPRVSRHKMRALERVGLVGAFREEME